MKRFNTALFLEKNYTFSIVRRIHLYYWGKGKEKSKVEIARYRGEEITRREANRLIRLMRHAYLYDAWHFDEFFLYQYDKLSKEGRKEFVAETEKNRFCHNVNPKPLRKLFNDKAQTYSHYSKYYHRMVCEFHSWDSDKDRYYQFVKEHYDYILKPIDASVGRGVQILHGVQENAIKEALEKYRNGVVLEELIIQDATMALPHPQSVNTVRITTFKVGGATHILHPFMRTGCGDSIVDNAGSGGLFCAIDIETGIIFASIDEVGKRYVVHPDTGVAIVGFRVPHWDEAIALAKELADVIPDCRYVGWDLALTDKGWVMVEGNSFGQFVGFQIPMAKGFRKELLLLDPMCLTFKRKRKL